MSEEVAAAASTQSSLVAQEKTSFIDTAIVDPSKQSTVYHRYYHMFLKGELPKLIEDNFQGRFEIRDEFFDHANWVVICEKVG